MENFVLSCCSTADMTKSHFDKRNIKYLCFHYFLDDVEHVDDFGETIPLNQFYQMMVDGILTRTSQINVETYLNYFENFLKEGKDVLHLTLSSGISGTYNSAIIARDMLKDKYPNRKLYVVDSLAASSGFGLLVDMAADLRDAGKSIDEVNDWILENRLTINHWFFSTDLTFFIRGGRVSKTSGFIGNMLHICPLLNVNDEGKLIPREKVLGKKKVILRIVEVMKKNAKNGLEYDGKCYISHSACIEDAELVKKLVEENFPKLKGKVDIFNIGTTIGAHTGPGTVALFFVGKKRGA